MSRDPVFSSFFWALNTLIHTCSRLNMKRLTSVSSGAAAPQTPPWAPASWPSTAAGFLWEALALPFWHFWLSLHSLCHLRCLVRVDPVHRTVVMHTVQSHAGLCSRGSVSVQAYCGLKKGEKSCGWWSYAGCHWGKLQRGVIPFW